MSIYTPNFDNGVSEELVKQRLIEIVGEDFDAGGRDVRGMADRDITWRLVDPGYGNIFDMTGLRITGSMGEWDYFMKCMAEEGKLARGEGYILKVNTGYSAKPVSWLLVLDLEKDKLTGAVRRRTRNVDKVGLYGVEEIPVYEVEMRELIEAIRAHCK